MFYITLSQTDNGIENVVHESDTVLTLDQLQNSVGGLIEPAFTVDSPIGDGHRSITAYVNEEGWLLDLPSFITIDNGDDRYPMAGNMVIIGLDERTGDTVLLEEEEVEWVKSRIDRRVGNRPPIRFESFNISV